MILNSTKFGGNWTKDVEVDLDRQADSYIPLPLNYVCGGYKNMGPQNIFLLVSVWIFFIPLF
jgi:hypothetical protein